MASVTSLGSNSSLSSLIAQLMTIERQPIYKLETKKGDLETLTGIYTDVKTKLTALRSVTQDIIDPLASDLDTRAVASADESVVTATATASAALGSHSIFVTQLAKHHTMVSDQITSADTDLRSPVGVGEKTFSITVNGTATEVTVTIDADDTNEDIIAATASAINTAMADVTDAVTASAFADTSSTSKLVFRSDSTGTDYKMTLADVSGSLLAALGIDDEGVAATDSTGGYIYADAALDAIFELDGVGITRCSNIVDDVLTGVTFTLSSHQESGDEAVDVTVSRDTSVIRETVEDFIEKYNDSLAYLQSKTAVDSTGVRQPLSHEYIYRSLIGSMRTIVGGSFSTGSTSVTMLSHLGIEIDSTGQLSLSDSDEFDEAIDTDASAVTALFKGTSGLATQIDDLLEPFVETGGYIDNNKTNVSDKIDSIDESIARLEERMTKKEARYIEQYSKLQESMAMLSSQQSFISSILSTMGWQ